MKCRRQLFAKRDLYDTAGTEELFFHAVKENVSFHLAHCPPYAELMQHRGFSVSQLDSARDLYRLPPLPTLFLKTHNWFSMPESNMLLKATSSGTKGIPSRVGIDRATSAAALRMVWRTFSFYGLLSLRPTNYIVLGYEPSKRNRMGAAQTAYATTLAAPALHREYALKDTGSAYQLNIAGLINALVRYEKQGHPVRFMGFPAYLFLLLELLEEKGIALQLHPRSKILLAGGWKQFFAQKTDKQALYQMARRTLGIGEENCNDFYGAVEHPVVYCDCENHHFHVPIYSRVILRDVDTLEPVGYGTPGIMNLVTPLVASMPLTSVLTDDVAILHPAGSCGCKIRSPWFELLGRAGLEDIKTCAAGAAELLQEVQV